MGQHYESAAPGVVPAHVLQPPTVGVQLGYVLAISGRRAVVQRRSGRLARGVGAQGSANLVFDGDGRVLV